VIVAILLGHPLPAGGRCTARVLKRQLRRATSTKASATNDCCRRALISSHARRAIASRVNRSLNREVATDRLWGSKAGCSRAGRCHATVDEITSPWYFSNVRNCDLTRLVVLEPATPFQPAETGEQKGEQVAFLVFFSKAGRGSQLNVQTPPGGHFDVPRCPGRLAGSMTVFSDIAMRPAPIGAAAAAGRHSRHAPSEM